MSGLLLSSPGAQDAAQATATVLGGASLPLTLAMAAVVGPLAEEVMFRGFLLSALQVTAMERPCAAALHVSVRQSLSTTPRRRCYV